VHLFLDTANIEQIRHGVKLGIISGVTTNPTLVAKDGHRNYKAAISEICSIVQGPVSAEVLTQETKSMVQEAREISSWSPYVVVKIPVTADGLEAVSVLTKEGIKVNLTLCFSVNQALLGMLTGATYISPFVGRLDDIGHDGMQLVADIVDMLKEYHSTTQVIAASIRHPLHCITAVKVGADIATIPFGVMMNMIDHPLTTLGIERFLMDWQSLSQ